MPENPTQRTEEETDEERPLGPPTEPYQPEYEYESRFGHLFPDYIEWASADSTIGQLDTTEMSNGEIEWFGMFTPGRLRAWAELLEFAYGGVSPKMGGGNAGYPTGTVALGRIDSDERPGGLLVAHPSGDSFSGRVTAVADRLGHSGNQSELFEDMRLPTDPGGDS